METYDKILITVAIVASIVVGYISFGPSITIEEQETANTEQYQIELQSSEDPLSPPPENETPPDYLKENPDFVL